MYNINNSSNDWIGCLLWLAIPFGLYFGCNYCESRSKNEKEEIAQVQKWNDYIHQAYILSLSHDLHYQDSLHKAEEERRLWQVMFDSICSKEIIGFVFEGDSVYHEYIHAMIEKEDGLLHNYSNADMPRIEFVSEDDIKNKGYNECIECLDYIYEYVCDYSEDFKDIFEDEEY